MTDNAENVLNDESVVTDNVAQDVQEEQDYVDLPVQEMQDGGVDEAPIESGEGDVEPKNNDAEPEAKKHRRRKRRKIDEYTLENDIKYRGPLSYRWLRILAWLFLIISQVGLLLEIGATLDQGNFGQSVGLWPSILKMLSGVMMPLFLIATFATILNGSRKFSSMLVLYGGAALIFYILFILLHERYVPAILMYVFEIDRESAVAMIDLILVATIKNGYLSFNIFVDLFICTIFGFFLIYRPKKVFVGKKLIWFRLLAILPIAWEIVSFVLKLCSAFGKVILSPYLYPLLTTKPPMTFIVFVLIALFIKARERIYRKRGKTHEQYEEFLKTKANSWQFSKFLAIIMIIAGILDLIIYVLLSFAAIAAVDPSGSSGEEAIATVLYVTDVLIKSGVGGSSALIVAAPIMLLFSYTRSYKNTRIEMFIPILAIIVLIFIYLEAMVIATKMLEPLSSIVQK